MTVNMNHLRGLDNDIKTAHETFKLMVGGMFSHAESISTAMYQACDKIGLALLKNIYADMSKALGVEVAFDFDKPFQVPSSSARFFERLDRVMLMSLAAVTSQYHYDTRESHRNTAEMQLRIARTELEGLIEDLV